MKPIYERFRDSIRSEIPVALATLIEGPRIGSKLLVDESGFSLGSLGGINLDRVVKRDALAMLDAGTSEVRHYGSDGEARQHDLSVFIECHARRPHLVIFGAVDFTRALASQGKLLGCRVTVCDAREVFATRRRFPMADLVVVDGPDRLLDRIGAELGPRDSVCVLTHDAKFDVPAITAALNTNVGYIGVMGSRKTHDNRSNRLREAGVSDEDFKRIMSPIGSDIGARTPEETAISICAEIIALRTGREANSLKQGSGPIHKPNDY